MINKTWIFLFSAVILGVASVSSWSLNGDEDPDYWDEFDNFPQDYDNYGDFEKLPEPENDENKSIFEETKEILNNDNDEDGKIEAIQEDRLIESHPVDQSPESDDIVQIWREINNFKNKLEDEQVNTDDDDSDGDDSDETNNNNDSNNIESNEQTQDTDALEKVISNEHDAEQDHKENESDENDEPQNEENKAIFEETKEILNNDNEDDDKIEVIPEDEQVESFIENDDNDSDEENIDQSDKDSVDSDKDTQDEDALEEAKPEMERVTSDEKDTEQDSDENESDENLKISNDDSDETENDVEEGDEILGEPDILVAKSKLETESENPTETKEQLADDDDDTVAKVVGDLKEDFKDLFETMDKLARDDDITDQDYVIEPNDDSSNKIEEKYEISNEDVIGYEEKYGKPFREDNILAMRDDYEYVEDSNLGSIFADGNSEEGDKMTFEELDPDMFNNENTKDEPESTKIKSVVEPEETQDSNVNEDKKTTRTITIESDNDEIETEASQNIEENINKSTLTPVEATSKEATDKPQAVDEVKIIESIYYDYVNEPTLSESDPDMFNHTWLEIQMKASQNLEKTNQPQADDDDNIETKQSIPVKSIDAGDLSPAQYNDLMAQFQEVHKNEFDTQSEDFSTHVAPIHMSLRVDEPLEITSPNYPNNYPTNNVVDWIFDGEGIGIEFNITDFAVNGVLGDYLLVKPGGADETGHEGLIFSYQLREERNYRFMDVDRMFVRFESKPGLGFNRGFKFSVKMIAPLPEYPEPEPTPQPLMPAPPSTLTINVGGLTASQFLSIREDFRLLIADMATLYINTNLVNSGLNKTSDVTQITSVAVCNINWPNFENCVEVTFGVPVLYEDEETTRLNEDDLAAMWNTYIYRDPFALRLRRLGITEFTAPNDQKTLFLWLLIAAGALISTVMLSFALWRYSCFQNYTRMSPYSDTDSIVDAKRGLDLYPTPHQTLPPLFSDQELKWDDKYDNSARVDMTGYNNSNYVRDELYGFESDDDVISPRDRNSAVGISPRDMYKV